MMTMDTIKVETDMNSQDTEVQVDGELIVPELIVPELIVPELIVPELIVEELLVEEISIDGMCGVY
jgi:mycofactocin precursor